MSPTLPLLIAGASGAIVAGNAGVAGAANAIGEPGVLSAESAKATMAVLQDGEFRKYRLMTTGALRNQTPPDKQVTFSEAPGRTLIRTGNVMFDGLYAMAVNEACENSVSQISDEYYAGGKPIAIEAYQTGEAWKYVWTRDLSYSLHLALAAFDPERSVTSLLFKASPLKSSLNGAPDGDQVVQDTGSGGSYPVSTDRVVWAMGAHETLKYLAPEQRQTFLLKAYPILCATIEQDRHLVFDPADGLYRGEQSFLDWREQTYPGWTKDNVLPIAMSKALSTNVANYLLLTHAAEYSRLLGKVDAQKQYASWAADLRQAINREFYDAERGLYSTYLLSDEGLETTRVARYDLLGESLAILAGIADEQQAASILAHYPTGAFGPPVVWPQEKSAPIYHNQGIWPFVTAYWIKAAKQVGCSRAVEAGARSLQEHAALNLSNMENFDFLTGLAAVVDGPRKGPQINSRRQLWSVAGYLSMVQDVIFGMETSWEGIRFHPFITAKTRAEIFGASDTIEWRGFEYQGLRNCVRVHLPAGAIGSDGAYEMARVELNGKTVTADFIKASDLTESNEWDIFLSAPPFDRVTSSEITVSDLRDEASIFGPAQPQWSGPITVVGDRLTLRYSHDDPAHVSFSIYRDGQLCAANVQTLAWTDPESSNFREIIHSYRVAAVDQRSGLSSHPTPNKAFRTENEATVIPARLMKNRGGNLVADHHFANWGKPGDELTTAPFSAPRDGVYFVRAEFANGAGPVSTGIACAVKHLEIRNLASGETIAHGYLVMPQSGDWARFDLSSVVKAELRSGESYVMNLSEDLFSKNMSYFQSNERYSGANGGGPAGYNYANIASLQLFYRAPAR